MTLAGAVAPAGCVPNACGTLPLIAATNNNNNNPPCSQVMSALDTFIQRVAWAPLDVLLIDMPPGTGAARRRVLVLADRLPA